MKRKPASLRPLLPVATLGLLSVSAQPFTPTELVPTPADSPNRLSASFRMAFNVDVKFENVGAFNAGSSQTTPDGDAFNYDDGYVLTDSSGNLMGYTRYWGYDYNSQLSGAGTMLMHRYSSGGTTAAVNLDEPLPGVELLYRRELGRGEKVRWGLEVAANYMRVNASDSQTLSENVTRLTDAYPLPPLEGGGYVTPPPAPYYHGSDLSAQGNPVIGATPVSSITDTMAATVSGSHSFDANVIGWRLGPYVEMPVGERGKLSLSGGLSLAYVLSDFYFDETVASPGNPTASGGGSDSGFLVGGYVAGEASYKLSKAWDVFGSAQFQYLGEYTQYESGHAAVLDLSKTVFVSVGLSYSF